jgi:hypothetical protein
MSNQLLVISIESLERVKLAIIAGGERTGIDDEEDDYIIRVDVI